ncbi:glycoprotein [Leptomonas pyrrhocoris leishbunyavirus 3]|uniref:Glycoprotein n=1 Tax=Leptomonas pyrrhocoris leishbunyavirus 3 TaxID=3070841 RepID=A0AA50KIC5_9VIRU|nr:glycoprotein [Leptomonas pyrrhocoris leishbunyavirus 3]WMB96308.1 glycoprotein [Leptomonas pyrrhocoris leishbunyavirus 3]WMB96311.1 glycoprotein [Leptomonas pyrrhocoris leishbunyavirus 3]WMB96315.1 glycoprotein [Leptomonas pyrrhocoris leishbunyavirus 3]WMB96318.1 glycoprotein [Leptomonas pyrrhocoris leishbunyavirus 3]
MFSDIGLVIARSNIQSFGEKYYHLMLNNVVSLEGLPPNSVNRYGFSKLNGEKALDAIDIAKSPYGGNNSFASQAAAIADGADASGFAYNLEETNLPRAMASYYLLNAKSSALDLIGRRSECRIADIDPSSPLAMKLQAVRSQVDERYAAKVESSGGGIEGYLAENRVDDGVYKLRVVDFRVNDKSGNITFPSTLCKVDDNDPIAPYFAGHYSSSGRIAFSFYQILLSIDERLDSYLTTDETLFLQILFCGQFVQAVPNSRLTARFYLHCQPGGDPLIVNPRPNGLAFVFKFLKNRAESVYQKVMQSNTCLNPNLKSQIDTRAAGHLDASNLMQVVVASRARGTTSVAMTRARGRAPQTAGFDASIFSNNTAQAIATINSRQTSPPPKSVPTNLSPPQPVPERVSPPRRLSPLSMSPRHASASLHSIRSGVDDDNLSNM